MKILGANMDMNSSMDTYVTGVLTNAGLSISSEVSEQVREAVRTIEDALRAKA